MVTSPDDLYPAPTRHLERLVEHLERMIRIYNLQHATAGVLIFLTNIEEAVDGLWQMLDERNPPEM
jgi:hypothetical protein